MSWRLGAILNEPLDDTLRFAAWYLEMGANGLTLLFDDPDDPAIEILSKHHKIECIRCTDKFWKKIGTSKEVRFPKRQNNALTWVYHRTQEDWLLNVDADEFVHLNKGRLRRLLGRQDAETEMITIAPAEVIEPIKPREKFVFRLPMDRDTTWRVYEEHVMLFGPRRQGLAGHADGKSIIRTGIKGVRLRQHWAMRPDGELLRSINWTAHNSAALLHFIGLDYGHWRAKLPWRVGATGFSRPMRARLQSLLDAGDSEDQFEEIHHHMHRMSPKQIAQLKAEDCCLELSIDFDAITQNHFPDMAAEN